MLVDHYIVDIILITTVVALSAVTIFYIVRGQRRARRELSEMLTQMAIFADSIPGGLIHTQLDDDFTLIYANRGYLELLGAPNLETERGKSAVRVVHPEDREAIRCEVLRQLRASGRVHLEHRIHTLDGRDIWALIKGRVVIDGDGVSTFYAIITDITSVKNAEAEKAAALNDLELARATEKAKAMFFANVAHDVRTPINAIIGMLHFLNRTALDDKQQHYLAKMAGAANILQQIVNDILDLSKLNENKISFSNEEVLLYDVITEIIDMFSFKCEEKNLPLVLNYEPAPDLCIICDRTRIFQVIMNLVGNAVKFTQQGRITIAVKIITADDEHVHLRFSVTDTGVGIPETDLERVWGEYEQVQNPLTTGVQGTGLGLALCKRIVEQLGGTIWAESKLGLGTTFTFELKFKIGDAESSRPRSTSTNNPANQHENLRGKRVLLVEDNEINVEIAKMVIEDLGLICETAFDGVEAIHACTGKPLDYYDVILTDIHMPRMDGYRASKMLKEEMHIKSPIFALTATTLDEDTLAQYKGIIDGFLAKPISPDALTRKLVRIFDDQENGKK